MENRDESSNMLAVLETLIGPDTDEVARKLAYDFRSRRVEKGITREAMAARSGVPLSNIARFEQKGLISLKNLIQLAIALGYLGEIQGIFSKPKYSTMDELLQIRHNTGKKKAYAHKSREK